MFAQEFKQQVLTYAVVRNTVNLDILPRFITVPFAKLKVYIEWITVHSFTVDIVYEGKKSYMATLGNLRHFEKLEFCIHKWLHNPHLAHATCSVMICDCTVFAVGFGGKHLKLTFLITLILYNTQIVSIFLPAEIIMLCDLV